jgi:hypothetical protein
VVTISIELSRGFKIFTYLWPVHRGIAAIIIVVVVTIIVAVIIVVVIVDVSCLLCISQCLFLHFEFTLSGLDGLVFLLNLLHPLEFLPLLLLHCQLRVRRKRNDE